MKKEFIRQKHISNGFTLVEALVAISILMIAIASPMMLAQKGLSTATLSKDQMTASFLAQDAIEAVRNIRDEIAVRGTAGDWLGTQTNNTLLSSCICNTYTNFCNLDLNTRKICTIDSTASSWTYGISGSNASIQPGVSGSGILDIIYDVDINGNKKFLKYNYETGPTISLCGSNPPLGPCKEVSKYTRYINIQKDPTGTNPNEAVIHVRVLWPSALGIQKIDLSDYIYNYSDLL